VIRWCERRGNAFPRILGIESDPRHVAVAKDRFNRYDHVELRQADFLRPSKQQFDYIVGNPPYVSITGLTPTERDEYRQAYTTAKGRFDLYLLFYEQALRELNPEGRLVFITPEKFLYIETARPFRKLVQQYRVEELHFLEEQTFGDLVTYPLIATISRSTPLHPTAVVHRGGVASSANLNELDGRSWLPTILGADDDRSEVTLGDICVRVSCGVATGADSVFVVRNDEIDAGLQGFAYRTIAGRQMAAGEPLEPSHSLLVPYTENGALLPEDKLGPLGRYLANGDRRAALLKRTCARRKPWYAFHENPPMADVRRPKLLCKDITPAPFFVPDRAGDIIPRHSVYYLVPADSECLDALDAYLNSAPAQEWLRTHCQRAANGFLRVQSHVLKQLPLPSTFASLRRTLPDRHSQIEAHLA